MTEEEISPYFRGIDSTVSLVERNGLHYIRCACGWEKWATFPYDQRNLEEARFHHLACPLAKP